MRAAPRRTSSVLLLAFLAGLVAVGIPATAPQAAAAECASVLFIGARGSGQDQDDRSLGYTGLGPEVATALDRLRDQLPSTTLGWEAVQYPAEDVGRLYRHTDEYFNGLTDGVSDVRRIIDRYADDCPYQRLVLSGYSQGAMVMHRVLQHLEATRSPVLARVAAVVLFGDGDRVARDSNVLYGDPHPGLTGIGQTLRSQSGSNPTRFGAELGARVRSVCLTNDPVCDSTGLLWDLWYTGTHLRYPTALATADAVEAAAEDVRTAVATGTPDDAAWWSGQELPTGWETGETVTLRGGEVVACSERYCGYSLGSLAVRQATGGHGATATVVLVLHDEDGFPLAETVMVLTAEADGIVLQRASDTGVSIPGNRALCDIAATSQPNGDVEQTFSNCSDPSGAGSQTWHSSGTRLAPESALTGPATLSLDGFAGVFDWGATRADAEAALGQGFRIEAAGGDCQQATLDGVPDVVFGIRDGRVVVAAGAVTDTGLRVGDTVARLRQDYPGVVVEVDPSDAYSTRLTFASDGREAQFISIGDELAPPDDATLDAQTVDYMQFGLAGSVGEAPCV